jgi:hypothetical protein
VRCGSRSESVQPLPNHKRNQDSHLLTFCFSILPLHMTIIFLVKVMVPLLHITLRPNFSSSNTAIGSIPTNRHSLISSKRRCLPPPDWGPDQPTLVPRWWHQLYSLKSTYWDFKRRVVQQEKFSPQGWLGIIIELSGKPEVAIRQKGLAMTGVVYSLLIIEAFVTDIQALVRYYRRRPARHPW